MGVRGGFLLGESKLTIIFITQLPLILLCSLFDTLLPDFEAEFQEKIKKKSVLTRFF